MAPEPAEDPVVTSSKEKLKHFRIQELKDVLHKLGLSKQGKKQELVDKIMAMLSDQQDQVSKTHGVPKKQMAGKEVVVKIVEDTFRKMREPANTAPASRNQIESGQSVKPKKKSDDPVKVRCPCGNSMATGSMIKCDDPQCNVWQHVDCVIKSEKPADSVTPETPSSFYCEICRISRADPFWVTINHPLLPASIAPSNIAEDGQAGSTDHPCTLSPYPIVLECPQLCSLERSYTVQYVEKTFLLSRPNWEMLQRAEYDIQVWCILFGDRVPFRMHWPLQSDLLVNGEHVRPVNRQPTQQLGANGRDDGPVLTEYLREGPNKIGLSKIDSRTFCLGVRIAKRRSLEEVLNLVPKEQNGEKFDDAIARVRRCVGGGTKADNADSDSDIEVVADSVSVNLRCPMTGSRIKIAGRFKPCVHMGCFDLEAFVELNRRSRKWQCPICLKNYSLENIIIDPYFNRITSLIHSFGDVSEIDVKPDGSWRIKGGAVLKDFKQWHLPDGTLHLVNAIESKASVGIVKQEIKEPLPEELSCRLKLGIRKNNNGKWEISKRGDANLMPSSDDDQTEHFSNGNCITPTSNNDHKNTKDGSYNSKPGQIDLSASNVYDLDFSPMDEHAPRAAAEQEDIIVLSDSDDDNVKILSPGAVNCGSAHDTGNQFPRTIPLETSGMFGEQTGGGPDETSFLLNESFDDLGLSFWEYPSSTRDNLSTQGTDNLVEVQNHPANHLYLHKQVSEVNSGVVAPAANTLESGQDSALQGSVSHTYADESLISTKNASQKRMNCGDEITALDDSILRGMDDDDLTRERCCDPPSPPQQPRSVRQRLVLNIDSESD